MHAHTTPAQSRRAASAPPIPLPWAGPARGINSQTSGLSPLFLSPQHFLSRLGELWCVGLTGMQGVSQAEAGWKKGPAVLNGSRCAGPGVGHVCQNVCGKREGSRKVCNRVSLSEKPGLCVEWCGVCVCMHMCECVCVSVSCGCAPWLGFAVLPKALCACSDAESEGKRQLSAFVCFCPVSLHSAHRAQAGRAWPGICPVHPCLGYLPGPSQQWAWC